jgi:hypothetical protein
MIRVDSYDKSAKTPPIGSEWDWARKQKNYPWGAREKVVVSEVKWNGEEWYVKTRGPRGEFWTDLTVFWEGVA